MWQLPRQTSSVLRLCPCRDRFLSSTVDSRRHEVQQLYDFLRPKRNVVCITGAGVSTASGIPDYRGVNGSYRKGHKPMVHSDFMGCNASRQRYWSRSMSGFRVLGNAKPNAAHIAIRQLQQRGVIKHIITQNVDGLHTKAGSLGVLNIHGRIDEVRCMTCHEVTCRHAFQSELEAHNPSFVTKAPSSNEITTKDDIRADGDIELDPSTDVSKVLKLIVIRY
jgi:NAD-dependent deacetylase sirtuin 4